jgi:hypothetical protein
MFALCIPVKAAKKRGCDIYIVNGIGQNKILTKIHPMGAELFHTDRQTDRQI